MGNTEAFLVRLAGVVETKYNDKELSKYILDLNALFLEYGYPKKIDDLALKINRDFHKNYLKEWK